MSPQPKDAKAYVRIGDKIYQLLKCLPGQRTAAAKWFQLFAGGCKEFGMHQDQMQPTVFIKHGEVVLTVHVGDAFMIGRESVLLKFVNFLKNMKGWKVEEYGPFQAGGKFFHLKRQFNVARTMWTSGATGSNIMALRRRSTCSRRHTERHPWIKMPQRGMSQRGDSCTWQVRGRMLNSPFNPWRRRWQPPQRKRGGEHGTFAPIPPRRDRLWTWSTPQKKREGEIDAC